MPSASQLRARIEADLAQKIPAALSPQAKHAIPVVDTGISVIDDLLQGGIPVGAITEMAGPECSGRTSLALSLVGRMTAAGKICAWVDVSDALHPESAAAMGVDLSRLLWVRCPPSSNKSWARLDQGLRVTDLLLNAGGFSCIVLDLATIEPEYALRIPLATWFRYRSAAERWQCTLLLMTQQACTRNSAGLVLRHTATSSPYGDKVFFGFDHEVEVVRQRFTPSNIFPMRKPPRNVSSAHWQADSRWAGQR
jgi:recombination protein RecA